MKILFAHASNPISTGRYYLDAFRESHDVVTCGPVIDSVELGEWREAEKEHAFKPEGAGEVEKMDLIARLAEPCDIKTRRGRVDIGEILKRLPDGWKPDLFICVDSGLGFLLTGKDKLNCPTACLIGDTHTGQKGWRVCYAGEFNYVFIMFNRQHIPHFEAAGCANVSWLPAACAPEIHGKVSAAKAYDIGFVGQTHRQWHPDRVRLLGRLIEAGFDVHIRSLILEEMALFYSRCRIVFNRSLAGDLNMRVFEALCSGSMLLTDRLSLESGMVELFGQGGRTAVLYSEDNMEEAARFYLENPVEREEIAAKGRKAVLAGHTYGHRVKQIVETVFPGRGQQSEDAPTGHGAKCSDVKQTEPEVAKIIGRWECDGLYI